MVVSPWAKTAWGRLPRLPGSHFGHVHMLYAEPPNHRFVDEWHYLLVPAGRQGAACRVETPAPRVGAGCDNSVMTDPGGDRPPASGAKTFSEWLAGGAPAQFAALLIVLFGRYLDLWLILTALAGLALYGVWKAPTVAHGPLIQRWLTPILVLAYTAFLVAASICRCEKSSALGITSAHGHHFLPEGGVTMSRRPSVNRMRENRTYGLKGGWGTRTAQRHLHPDYQCL